MVCHIQMVSYKLPSILFNTWRAILLFIFRYGLIYEVIRYLEKLRKRLPSCINELIFILIIFGEIFYLCEIFNAVGAFMRIWEQAQKKENLVSATRSG